MPLKLDLREIMAESRGLIKTGSVSPLRFTLLLLGINALLSLLSTLANYYISIGPQFGVSFLTLSFAGILVSLVGNVLTAGYNCYCLGLHRGEHMPYDSLFDGFAFAGKVIGLMVVEGFFVALWSMLFIIPGFIAMFRYSFSLWNLCQDPSMGILTALNLSKQQTKGYKLQLLSMYVQFAPWFFLAAAAGALYGSFLYPLLPTGLAGLLLDTLLAAVISGAIQFYFLPYLTLSQCGFYLRATGQNAASAQDQSGWDPEF